MLEWMPPIRGKPALKGINKIKRIPPSNSGNWIWCDIRGVNNADRCHQRGPAAWQACF